MTTSLRRRLLRIVGGCLVVIAAAGAAYPLWWNHRSHAGGSTLIAEASAQFARVDAKSASRCAVSKAAAVKLDGSTPGILEIPAIGLTAPVLNGLSDSVLNIAVGHDPSTIWPGSSGESIVEAHDVSYFTNLSKVRAGDRIVWLTTCSRSQFQVLSTVVRQPGDELYTPAGGAGLALITCYPTNALFWTSERFVVTTRLVSTVVGAQSLPAFGGTIPRLVNLAPKALVAEGLALNQNALPMGVLHVEGTPSAAFTTGPAPLAVEADALAVFFGGEKAVAQRNKAWWSDLADASVPFPRSWPRFGQTDVLILVTGANPASITFSSGAATVIVTNEAGVLRIAQVLG